jgi:hypothetical protein
VSAGQAAGTHYALSGFCAGTTIQCGRCDLGPSFLGPSSPGSRDAALRKRGANESCSGVLGIVQ